MVSIMHVHMISSFVGRSWHAPSFREAKALIWDSSSNGRCFNHSMYGKATVELAKSNTTVSQ